MSQLVRVVATCLLVLSFPGCARMAARDAVANAGNCLKDARATPEGQIVAARIWMGTGGEEDSADKLVDAKPLTKDERNALVRYHAKLQTCRQIIINHDNRYAAWETPYWQEAFQRSDAIYLKLVSGKIPVGVANRLSIESVGKFQVDVSRAHADAVRIEEAQRQRAAEALLQASAQTLAAQPRTTMTNCSWFGNTLNCTTTR